MIFAPILLSGLVAIASAKKTPNAFTKTLVSKCMTASGPSSVATLATITMPVQLSTTITSFSTSTPSTTITPDPETEVTVEISTTTFTEDTVWESSTAFETQWASFSEFSTTTPTIMPSAGYTPIFSQVAGLGKTPAKRDDALVARADSNSLTIKNGNVVLPPQQYPTRVQCINVVYIVYTRLRVVPAMDTLTITAATPMMTTTSTYIVSETTTEAVQDATTTTTVTETDTIYHTSTAWQTSTLTSSTTTTSLIPAATPYYAACASNNILSSVNGQGINRIDITPQQNFIAAGSGIASAYDCCVAAINGGYAGSVFRPQDASCYVLSTANGVCDATTKSFSFYSARAQTPSGGFVVSNGNCGLGQLVTKSS